MRLLLVAAPMVWGAAGCGGANVNVGETHVGKEELYKTGNFDYDDFFEDIKGIQDSAKAVANDEKAARAPFGQVLGVGETSIDRMLEVLRDKAMDFAQGKARVHFELEGLDDQGKPQLGKAITVTPSAAKGKALPKEATDFASSLEEMLQKESQVWEKYGPLGERGKRLSEKAETLRGSLDKEFATATRDKREEIDRELKAAKAVSEQVGDLSDKVVANAVRFVKQSGEVLTAAANAEPKKEEKAQKGSKGTKAATSPAPSKPKEGPAKPKEAPPKQVAAEKPASATPSPKPAPPAESGGDFNP